MFDVRETARYRGVCVKRLWVGAPLACVALLAGMAAHGQAYPGKPVRLIVPFTPGGGTDIATRIIAPKTFGAAGAAGVGRQSCRGRGGNRHRGDG